MRKFIKIFELLVVIGGVGLSIWGGQEVTKYLTTNLFNLPIESMDSSSGLIGYWDMNLDGGSNGTVRDLSRYSHDGTNSGATAVEGKIGAGMDFDGSDSVILGNHFPSISANGTYSISLWFKTSSISTDGTLINISPGGSSSDRNGIFIKDSKIYAGYWNGSNYRMKFTDVLGSEYNNEYIHVVLINSSGTVSVYMNGVDQINSGSPGSGLNTNNEIGHNSTAYFTGIIDEVRFYDRVLTTDEITALYQQGNIGKIVLNGQTEDGVIGWWKLNAESSNGTTILDSSSENNGTSANTPVFTTDHHGSASMAMDFNGSSDYVNLGNILDLDKDDPVTFSFWLYPDVLESTSIISKSDSIDNDYKGWQIHTSAGAVTYRNYYNGTGSGIRVGANNALTATEWNHVTISYDGSENAVGVKIYYDGVLQEDTDAVDTGFAGSTLNNLDMTLGKYAYIENGHINGKLSDFRIYNRELSASEIADVYNSYNPSIGNSSHTKGFVGHWPLTLEQSNGAVIKDLGAGENNGTALNTPEVGSRETKFNGTDQYIDVGDTSQTAVKTFSFWLQADDITSHTDYPLDLNGTDYISIVDGEVTLGGFADGTNIIYTDSVSAEATIPDITGWHHVVVTSTTGRNVSDMDIARLEGSGYHDGKIADVKFWDRVLSSTEIQQLYEQKRSVTSIDRAVNFDSTNYVSLADDGSAGSAQDFDIIDGEDFMFETWLKTANKSAFYVFGSKRVGGASLSIGWMAYLYNDLFYFELSDGTEYVNKITSSGLENDTWMHFVGTYDASEKRVTLYTNGVSRGTNSNTDITSTLANSSNFTIGALSNGTTKFNGQMDNVRVYNFGADGLPSDMENIVSYNYGEKGRIHKTLTSYLVEAWDFDGDIFAEKDVRHDLTNNGGATFVKP